MGLLAAAALHAGVARGVVMEHASGLPLARTIVRLTPLPNTHGIPLDQRTNAAGVFTFQGAADGVYLLSASR